MGIVWRFKDLTEHYRFITLQFNLDGGESGPWRKLEVRLGRGKGEKLPFYETIKTEKGKSYTPGTLTHWKLEVRGNTFSVEVDGKKACLGKIIDTRNLVISVSQSLLSRKYFLIIYW